MEKSYQALGLMSGTSLDGLDLCLARFSNPGNWQYEILAAETIEYSPGFRQQLESLFSRKPEELQQEHIEFGTYLGRMAADFLNRTGIPADLVSSHGHTFFHRPELGQTFQLGEGAAIAATCKLPVICDFRRPDVKAGGQGAPLVPVGDEYLFPGYDACLNLGGFSNISMKRDGRRIAFDICPVNMLLNHIAAGNGLVYDRDGEMARRGRVDPELLGRFESLAFYGKSGPRSLGREWFEQELLPLLESRQGNAEGLMRTAQEHIILRLLAVFEEYRVRDVLLTGGGVYNKALVEGLQERTATVITLPSEELISFKEALVFGFLGVLRMRGEINVFASVTGAPADHCAGTIHLP